MTQPTQSLFERINSINESASLADRMLVKRQILQDICAEFEQRQAEAERKLPFESKLVSNWEKFGAGAIEMIGALMSKVAQLEGLAELDRLREIEHRAWHIFDDSMDDDSGFLKIDMEISKADLDILYELLPSEHPPVFTTEQPPARSGVESGAEPVLAPKPNDLLNHLGVIKERSKDWPEFMRTGTQPTELEMHRADYAAIKEYGFESPGELLAAHTTLLAATERVEPVGWMSEDPAGHGGGFTQEKYKANNWRMKGYRVIPVYTHPPKSQAEPVAVPEGWQLVPIEPTDEMVNATFIGLVEDQSVQNQIARRKEMKRRIMLAIAAAPKAGE